MASDPFSFSSTLTQLSDGTTVQAPTEDAVQLSDGTQLPSPITAGLITGLSDVPVVGELFGNAMEAAGADMVALERITRQSRAGQLVAGASQLLPTLFVGGAAFKLGRVAGELGLARVAPSLATALGSGKLGTAFARVAGLADDFTGNVVNPTTRVPGLTRMAQMVGGSTAFGTLDMTDALLEGQPFMDSLEDGAQMAALGIALEGGLTLVAKGLFKAARERDLTRIRELRDSPQRQQFLDEIKESFVARDERISNALTAIRSGKARPKDPQRARELLLQQRRALSTQENVFDRLFDPNFDDALRNWYLRGDPKGLFTTTEAMMLQLVKTPETLLQEMASPTAGLFLRATQEMVAARSVALSRVNRTFTDIHKQAIKAHGGSLRVFGPKALVPTHGSAKFMREEAFAYHQAGGGTPGVDAAVAASKARQPEIARAVWGQIDDELRRAKQALRAAAIPEEVIGKGIPLIPNYQLPPELLERGMVEALMKGGGLDEASAVKAAGSFLAAQRRGGFFFAEDLSAVVPPGQFGKVFTHAVKHGRGMKPVFLDDPIVALQQYSAMADRVEIMSRYFGPKGWLVDKVIVPLVRAEGGSAGFLTQGQRLEQMGGFGQVAAAVMGRTEQSHAGAQLAQAVANLQIGTKLALAVFPNAAQTMNTIMFSGFRNTWNGLVQGVLRSGTREKELLETLAVQDSIVRAMRETFLDPNTRTVMGKFADFVLWGSQFTRVERWNRMVGGAAALQDVSKTLGKSIAGRLRGTNMLAARRRFQKMGFNLDKMTQEAREVFKGVSPGEAAYRYMYEPGMSGASPFLNMQGQAPTVAELAAWQGIRLTQFIPDPTRKPLLWSTPAGRVLFQFKTFALNQARFMRDSVVSEFARGNAQPLMYYLTVAPLAGEVVADVRSLFKPGREGRPEERGLERVLNNFFAVGGIGIASDMFVAARYGFLKGQVMGPTLSDAIDIGEQLAQGDTDGLWKGTIARQPIYRASRVMLGAPAFGAVEAIRAFDELIEAEDEGASAGLTFNDLRRRSR